MIEDNWRGMGYYYFDRDRLKAAESIPAPAVTTKPVLAPAVERPFRLP